MHYEPPGLAQRRADLDVVGWVVVRVEEDDVAGARDVEARATGRGADEEHERGVTRRVEPGR